MLLTPQERSSSKKGTGLNRWKQFTRKPSPTKPMFDPDNMEHWIKRVEKASEFAVSNLSRRPWGQIIDLETPEQIEDRDEVYAEAQELVNDWLDTKLKQELASDGEGDAEDTELSSPPFPEVNGHLKYDKFDDLCGYLEEEEESTTVQKFIDHLLHKDVVDSRMLEDLGMNENQDKKQQKDPHLTMEMRHKQVKENRLRREKELERQKIEKTLKKSAFLEAHFLVQEEKKRKALEAKKEEEEIQREMVKLRREIIERRRTVEEAWKIEKKKQDENSPKNPEKGVFQSVHILDAENIAKERKKKLKKLLIQTFKEDCEVPLQNVPLDTSDDKPHKTLDLGPFQQPGNKKLRTSSQKAEPIRMGYFHNRHIFQQQLIEKQKKKLQEQQKTILELKKNQQLAEVPQAVGHGDARSCLLSNPREDEQERTCQRLSNSPVESPGTEHGRSESRNSLSGPRRNPRQLMAPHPILKAMEERAVQRAERRRILAERKKKQEEEKLAQLKAQEEERQKREAEEKEAKLEKKREKKRLKKMVL